VSQPPELPEILFVSCTPCIYRTCKLIENLIKPTLTFESKLDERLFLAILSSHPIQHVFVKLVSGHYLQQVHEHLAAKGLALKLYSYAKVDGTPTAYIMEYLDPSKWETLHMFMTKSSTVLFHTELWKALEDIIDTLRSKNYIHGDL